MVDQLVKKIIMVTVLVERERDLVLNLKSIKKLQRDKKQERRENSQVEEQHRCEQQRKRIKRDETLDCMHHDNIQQLYDLVHQDSNVSEDGLIT